MYCIKYHCSLIPVKSTAISFWFNNYKLFVLNLQIFLSLFSKFKLFDTFIDKTLFFSLCNNKYLKLDYGQMRCFKLSVAHACSAKQCSFEILVLNQYLYKDLSRKDVPGTGTSLTYLPEFYVPEHHQWRVPFLEGKSFSHFSISKNGLMKNLRTCWVCLESKQTRKGL